MSNIILVHPSIEYKEQVWQLKEEFFLANESLAGGSGLEAAESFEAWIKSLEICSDALTCPKGKVPSSLYLAIRTEDNRVVGVIDLRHHIDHPILSVWGGHIGYAVRKSERQKGYAKEMLRLNLEHAKQRGIQKVLITCDKDNIASKKTILSNHGVYEKDVVVENEVMERYWISL